MPDPSIDPNHVVATAGVGWKKLSTIGAGTMGVVKGLVALGSMPGRMDRLERNQEKIADALGATVPREEYEIRHAELGKTIERSVFEVKVDVKQVGGKVDAMKDEIILALLSKK